METYIYYPPYGGSYEVRLEKGKYRNGSPMLTMIDTEDGLPIMVMTDVIPDEPLADGEVIIKNYDENEGIFKFLRHHNLVSEQKRLNTVPHPQCIIADLNMETERN
jgi:hypothetical protein